MVVSPVKRPILRDKFRFSPKTRFFFPDALTIQPGQLIYLDMGTSSSNLKIKNINAMIGIHSGEKGIILSVAEYHI